MGAWISLLLLVIAALVLLLRADTGPIAGFDPPDFAILLAGVALVIFIGSSLAGSYRGRAGQAARDLLSWVLVAVVLVGGYSYREELLGLGHRVAGELLPPGTALRGEPQVVGERAVQIRKRSDGHFMVKTETNGIVLSMLVDTGASTVVLKPADAQRSASTSIGCAMRCRSRRPTAPPMRQACACATWRSATSFWKMSMHSWPAREPSRTTCSV